MLNSSSIFHERLGVVQLTLAISVSCKSLQYPLQIRYLKYTGLTLHWIDW